MEETRTLPLSAFLTTCGGVPCSKSAPLNRLKILEGRILVSFILVPRVDPAHTGDGGAREEGPLSLPG